MLVNQLVLMATFVATSGIAAIGILVAYQLFSEGKRAVFQMVLYQQIFLFSFLIYSIWGNLVIRQFIADVQLPGDLEKRLALIIPLLGTPFLIVSWLMLMKFSFALKKIIFSAKWILL